MFKKITSILLALVIVACLPISASATAKIPCQNTAVAPIVSDVTTNSITLVDMYGYEYSRNGSTWQASPIFTGLSANTTYTFYQRIKATTTEYASDMSAGVSVTTASSSSTVNSGTYYQKLRSYISANGKTNSQGAKTITYTVNQSSQEDSFILTNSNSGIRFCLHTVMNSGTINRVDFILSPTSRMLSVNYMYVESIFNQIDTTISIDRSTYMRSGSYYSTVFDTTMETLCVYLDNKIYDKLGFGLEELGFISFNGYGSAACDEPSGYHTGPTEIRNARDASCMYDGYTGDTYCTACNSKTQVGEMNPSKYDHKYSTDCDTACNECGWKRAVTHSFTATCDAFCDICGTFRDTNESHIYDNDNDKNCNQCHSPRSLKFVTGWNLINNKWYYYATHTPSTGWVFDGVWYYLNDDGSMATGWVLDGSTWYYMNAGGTMHTGWLYDGAWYYMNISGAMHTGWLYDGAWYYMNAGGAMTTGWVMIDNDWYYMNAGGAMHTGWLYDGAWYYLGTSGAMHIGWLNDGGIWYYMNAGGVMQTGWIQDGETWYYLSGNNQLLTGWHMLGGQWYYFYSSGAMAANTLIDDCWLAANGVWIPNYNPYQREYHTLVYTDANVDIYLKQLLSDELIFEVTNKTGSSIIIQADTFAINGRSTEDIIMSSTIAARSTGIADASCSFPDVHTVGKISGQFRIIRSSSSNSYDALFKNVTVDSSVTDLYPSIDLPLVYSDSKVRIYFKYVTDDGVYFTVENLTGIVISIQADTVTLNGRSTDDIIMSDDVSPYSVGDVKARCTLGAGITHLYQVGGTLRVIDFNHSFNTYSATFSITG